MKRNVLGTLTALLVAASVPALAFAKGPSEATIDGPGLADPVSIPSDSQSSAPFWRVVDEIGFFPAVFRQTPDPMLPKRPRGSLGPRYVVTYALPARTTLRTPSVRTSIRTQSRDPSRTRSPASASTWARRPAEDGSSPSRA
jgi:hypothetical protein